MRYKCTKKKSQVTLGHIIKTFFKIPIQHGQRTLSDVYFEQVSYQRLTFTEIFNITVIPFLSTEINLVIKLIFNIIATTHFILSSLTSFTLYQ